VIVTSVSTLKMEAVYYPKTLMSTYHELHAQLFLQPLISVAYEMTFYFSKILVQQGILWKGTVPFESGYTKFHTQQCSIVQLHLVHTINHEL
jgi:hypothetical protein